MKRNFNLSTVLSIGSVVALSISLAACSHDKSKSESAEQPGQAQTQPQAKSQSQGMSQSQAMAGQTGKSLGEEHVSKGTAEIQREKKVISTVIVRDKIPTVRESTVRADINRMDAKQFAAIGFSGDVAQNIVQYRDRNGQFKSVNDLAQVDGVSQSMLDRLDGALGVASTSSAGISGQNSDKSQSGDTSQSSGYDQQQ